MSLRLHFTAVSKPLMQMMGKNGGSGQCCIIVSGNLRSRLVVYTVRIPENPYYRPYAEFAKNPEGYFSVSPGDIVILGECPEYITGKSGNTAAQVLNRYRPDAFQVTAFSDNTAFPMAKHYRLGG